MTDSTLLLRTAIAQGDLTALLTELSHQLHQQAAALIRLPASPDVLKAQQSLLKMQSLMPRFQTSVDALVHERQSLHALYEVGQSVNSTLELAEVLNQVMDRIIQFTGAERSFLMLKDESSGEMEVRVARNVDRAVMTHSDFAVSRTIVQQVAAEGKAIATTNAQADPRFAEQESVVAYALRSILCVPLIVRDQVTGVIYADNRIRTGLFGDKERELLAAFAGGYPAVNVGSTAKSIELYTFAPGIGPATLDVQIEKGVLTIAGERKRDAVPEKPSGHIAERFAGRFRRVVTLPDDIDPGAVEARYRDGVLHISVARKEAAQPRRITVQ